MLDFASDGANWPLRVHSRFVSAGGLRWHVQKLGTGPTLLLIHGTGASSHSWRDVAPLLAGHFSLVIPDLPGHAFTRGRPAHGLTLRGMSTALQALLDELKVQPALVAAHSAGVAIAARMAIDASLQAPIVAFGPALLPMGGSAAPLFGGLAKLLFLNPVAPHLFAGVARSPERVAGFLHRATGSRIDRTGVQLYSRLFSDLDHVRGTIEMMSGWRLDDLARSLPKLGTRLSIFHGERDSAISLSEARRAADLAGASLVTLPGLGHLAHEERPDLAAQLIIERGERA